MTGTLGLVPFDAAVVGWTAGSCAHHCATVHGVVQLPLNARGPPVSLPLLKRRLCWKSRPPAFRCVESTQAEAAVALSLTAMPEFRKFMSRAFATTPAVPRRKFDACSVFSLMAFVWACVPISVTLQTFGALRGSRSKPFSLLSHSKP